MARPASTHKPRRRTPKALTITPVTSPSPAATTPTTKTRKSKARPEVLVRAPSFPLSALLWPARSCVSQWETLPLILMVTGLFRWAAGLWGYSGFEKPPMFGDYEAQRHWMEVTTRLPVSQWYFHDLEWWGLDYPPLTAYHSWLCGVIGSLIDPSWFALYTSRGSHDPTLKVFMRATVIVSEYLVYVPAVVVFVRRFSRLNGVTTWSASVALVAILMQPATMLIDHVHFQYNTVMLGFVVAAISSMLAARYMWASVFFVAALGFKQMALYYAFSVFAYLLGCCTFPRINVARFVGIALVTLASATLLVLPVVLGTYYNNWRSRPDLHDARPPPALFPQLADYLQPESLYYPFVEQMLQMVHRIFPFARGLFEDKVANFWCALDIVFKLRRLPPARLQQAALMATLTAAVPPNLLLFARPRRELLPFAFAATAWAFFLFSYQVHEKSVLLPLLPTTLLLAGRGGLGRDVRAWVGFANLLGCWTLFPLLRRVGLAVPYAVLSLLWAHLLGLPPVSLGAYFQESGAVAITPPSWSRFATTLVHLTFYLAMAVWHVAEAFVKPPPGKPDLWLVLNVGLGAAGFTLCYLWCVWRLLVVGEVVPASWTAEKGKAKVQ